MTTLQYTCYTLRTLSFLHSVLAQFKVIVLHNTVQPTKTGAYSTVLYLTYCCTVGSLCQTIMTSFAGSAIKQGKGTVASYCGSSPPTRWLLLSGAFNPPNCVTVSERRSKTTDGNRNGGFLRGATKDISNMVDCVIDNNQQLHHYVQDMNMSKQAAKNVIIDFFKTCQQEGEWPMLYYTGHGEVGTGNWCFKNGTLSLEEVLSLKPFGISYVPNIFCDTCYSGHWANACVSKDIGANCLSACPEFSTALDTSNHF